MVTRLERNRLCGERTALLDEVAEESRLANISARQLQSIANLVHTKHDECLKAIDEGHDCDEVIKAYRSLIWKILKKL